MTKWKIVSKKRMYLEPTLKQIDLSTIPKMSFQHFRLGELSLHQPPPTADQGSLASSSSHHHHRHPFLNSSLLIKATLRLGRLRRRLHSHFPKFRCFSGLACRRRGTSMCRVRKGLSFFLSLPSTSHLHPARGIRMEVKQTLRDSRIIQNLSVLDTPVVDVRNMSKSIQKEFARFPVER